MFWQCLPKLCLPCSCTSAIFINQYVHIQRCLFVKHCQSPGTSLGHYAIHHLQSWYGRSVRAHRSVNTGRLVWTFTEMLFPCTRGLSLMKLSTSGPKDRLCLQCKIECIDDRQNRYWLSKHA